MACCGPSKSNFDIKKLDAIRKEEEKIQLKLDEQIYEFDPENGAKWKGKSKIIYFNNHYSKFKK